MRLFIAYKLSDNTKNAIINYQNNMKKMGITGNYSHKENLHITLAFIGEVDKNNYEKIKESIKNYRFEKTNIHISGIGSFSEVVYAHVDYNEYLNNVAKQLRKILDNNKIEYSKSKFKAHITLIRQPNSDVKSIMKNQDLHIDDDLKEIILYESTRINGKLTYIEKLKLEANNG